MNNLISDVKKQKEKLKIMQLQADKLIDEIAKEPDFDKSVELNNQYNNICYRIEAEENYLFPDKKKKAMVQSYTRVKNIPTKRCGSC